eukprot:3135989-Lingulodinium_polyedra.AAC.1
MDRPIHRYANRAEVHAYGSNDRSIGRSVDRLIHRSINGYATRSEDRSIGPSKDRWIDSSMREKHRGARKRGR